MPMSVLKSPWSAVQRYWDRRAVNRVHRLYYKSHAWAYNRFLGIRVKQLPSDVWTYQHLLWQDQPAFVLQTGICDGGSLLFFARMLDMMDADPAVPVIGVDVRLTKEAQTVSHPRIHMVVGDAVASNTLAAVERLLPSGPGMVSLDSDHSYEHVRRELQLYSEYVGVGQHLVVEDTNVNGNPVSYDHGPGPMEAVDEFLVEDRRFEREDALWQGNLFSFHQFGWLKRVA